MRVPLLFLFVISLNLACFIISYGGLVSVGGMPTGYYDVNKTVSLFSFPWEQNPYGIITTIAGASIIGLLGLITGAWAWVMVGVLLWVCMQFVTPLQMLTTGFPTLVGNIIDTLGGHSSEAAIVSTIAVSVITVIVVYSVFMFFMEILGQRGMH